MANLQGSKDILESILKDLSSEISSQVRAKRGNQKAIETYLEQIDETIMFEIGNMVNAIEQADKEAIQTWVEEANKKSKEMLNRYKGRNTSVDAALKSSNRTFARNQSNTVLKEMEKAENEEGAYKREDFTTRYQKNEDAIKKAKDMKKKSEIFDAIKGRRKSSQIMDDFIQVVGKDTASGEVYGTWKERIENLEELVDYEFRNEIRTLQRRLLNTTDDKITPEVAKSFKTLQDKLSKIDFDASYNNSLDPTTKQRYTGILSIDKDLNGVSKDDLRAVIGTITPDDINRLERDVGEISNPDGLQVLLNEAFMLEIQDSDLFELFQDDVDKIEDIINSKKSVSEKSAALEAIFKEEKETLKEVSKTSVEAEKNKLKEAKLRKRELDQERAQAEKHDTAEKEHNDFKDIEEMARGELDELSDEVNALETETNQLESEATNLNAEVTRLENEYMGLAMELAEDEDKRRQLAEAQATRQSAVDPTKLDLEDLGFSKEFQLEKESLSGFNPTTVYHNFVTEDVSQRSGRNQDGDNLIDAIYSQLKKESGFANVAEKLKLNGYTEIKEVKHPRLSKMWASIRSHIPKLKNTDSRRESAIKDALTKEIEKRITALRDAHAAAQSAPIPDVDIMSDDDRLAKERAYEAHETLLQTAEENFNEVYERYTNTYNDYTEKKEDFEGKTVIYNDIQDKYNARKASFEESLKLQGEDKAKFMANEQKAIYKTVKDGKRVDAKSVRDEAEGEEIDI